MVKAWCNNCNKQKEMGINHQIAAINNKPYTEVICIDCGIVAATFSGFVKIVLKEEVPSKEDLQWLIENMYLIDTGTHWTKEDELRFEAFIKKHKLRG